MRAWRRLADAVLSALIAPPCAVCAQVLDRPLDGAVCERCWQAIVRGPHGRGIHLQYCDSDAIFSASAIGEYDGVLREIIHALKYHHRRSTAARLSLLMAAHASSVLAGADAVVPVPLHRQRHRQRGFNQADDLAQALGLPVVRALRRRRSTQPQVDLPAADRHRNVKDAFAVVHGRLVIGKILVLVDDVATTGATLEACARALKQAGAAQIRALTAARVSSAPR